MDFSSLYAKEADKQLLHQTLKAAVDDAFAQGLDPVEVAWALFRSTAYFAFEDYGDGQRWADDARLAFQKINDGSWGIEEIQLFIFNRNMNLTSKAP